MLGEFVVSFGFLPMSSSLVSEMLRIVLVRTIKLSVYSCYYMWPVSIGVWKYNRFSESSQDYGYFAYMMSSL